MKILDTFEVYGLADQSLLAWVNLLRTKSFRVVCLKSISKFCGKSMSYFGLVIVITAFHIIAEIETQHNGTRNVRLERRHSVNVLVVFQWQSGNRCLMTRVTRSSNWRLLWSKTWALSTNRSRSCRKYAAYFCASRVVKLFDVVDASIYELFYLLNKACVVENRLRSKRKIAFLGISFMCFRRLSGLLNGLQCYCILLFTGCLLLVLLVHVISLFSSAGFRQVKMADTNSRMPIPSLFRCRLVVCVLLISLLRKVCFITEI